MSAKSNGNFLDELKSAVESKKVKSEPGAKMRYDIKSEVLPSNPNPCQGGQDDKKSDANKKSVTTFQEFVNKNGGLAHHHVISEASEPKNAQPDQKFTLDPSSKSDIGIEYPENLKQGVQYNFNLPISNFFQDGKLPQRIGEKSWLPGCESQNIGFTNARYLIILALSVFLAFGAGLLISNPEQPQTVMNFFHPDEKASRMIKTEVPIQSSNLAVYLALGAVVAVVICGFFWERFNLACQSARGNIEPANPDIKDKNEENESSDEATKLVRGKKKTTNPDIKVKIEENDSSDEKEDEATELVRGTKKPPKKPDVKAKIEEKESSDEATELVLDKKKPANPDVKIKIEKKESSDKKKKK